MFGLTFSYKYLFFLRSAQPAEPVAPGLHRYWIETPRGPLELLAAEPDDATGPAIVFCHGGMGGAWVWTEYMTYLKAKGVRCYAISLRGHGDSWYVGSTSHTPPTLPSPPSPWAATRFPALG